MRVALPYGPGTLSIELPDGAAVARRAPLVPAPPGAIEAALGTGGRNITALAAGRDSVCIAIPDATRPPIARRVMEILVEQLAGAPQIDVVVATGTHREATPAEIERLAGPAVARRVAIRSHDAQAGEHVLAGRLASGVPIEIDAGWMRATFRIAIGIVEPHLLAGWSGGAKTICPGLASLETVRGVHRAALARGRCGPGIVDGNPFREEIETAAALAPVDVAIQLVAASGDVPAYVAAGEVAASTARAIAFAAPRAILDVASECDVVVTTAGGWPLDRTLYQAVKGWMAGLGAVRPGGHAILCARLDGGIGSAEFESQLRRMTENSRSDDADALRAPRRDAWMLQHVQQARARAQLHLVSSLPAEQVSALGFIPWPDVTTALAAIGARPESILCLPDGPQAIVRVASCLRTLEGVAVGAGHGGTT